MNSSKKVLEEIIATLKKADAKKNFPRTYTDAKNRYEKAKENYINSKDKGIELFLTMQASKYVYENYDLLSKAIFEKE